MLCRLLQFVQMGRAHRRLVLRRPNAAGWASAAETTDQDGEDGRAGGMTESARSGSAFVAQGERTAPKHEPHVAWQINIFTKKKDNFFVFSIVFLESTRHHTLASQKKNQNEMQSKPCTQRVERLLHFGCMGRGFHAILY